ncbi:MAG TPA: hypothetical protein VGP25_20905 [Gemmatimonadaceae bacterium]|nr:hypothetical protein [Gemmatimonadaceae bacterium]
MRNDPINPFDPAEPRRDEQLAALLRQATGDVPVSAVDWDALATRIARAIPSRAAATWWSYAERWERRMLPLAIAASLVGAIALWNSTAPATSVIVAQVSSTDILSDVVQGTPTELAALRYARTVTPEMTIADAGPE